MCLYLQDMRKSYNTLQEKSAGTAAQYERTLKMLDKIRADNQGKLLELGRLRQELQTLGDRMRTLENKGTTDNITRPHNTLYPM